MKSNDTTAITAVICTSNRTELVRGSRLSRERIVTRSAAPEVGLLGGPGVSVFGLDVTGDPRRLFLGQRFLGDYRPYEEFVEIGRDNPPLGLNLSYRIDVAQVTGW